jgi:manganese-dependent inorganic pyrophosphatase
MNFNDDEYDPVGGHTKEEADAAFETLFRELHGDEGAKDAPGAWSDASKKESCVVVGHTRPDTDAICATIAYAELKNQVDSSTKYLSRRAGEINAETAYVLQKFGVEIPELLDETFGHVILVDHNGADEIAPGARAARIVEIVDHHRLSAPETAEPLYVRIAPVGACCTIVYALYREWGVEPQKPVAGLICAGIISDTDGFNAVRTTREDKIAAVETATIAGLDIEVLAGDLKHRGVEPHRSGSRYFAP